MSTENKYILVTVHERRLNRAQLSSLLKSRKLNPAQSSSLLSSHLRLRITVM